jgi:hypothetical protein
MSLINEGLNRPANFEGSILTSQEQRKKLNAEERREFEKKRLKLEVAPQEFPGLISAMCIDSEQLAITINALMRSIFSDFHGSKLEVTGNRQLVTSLFFSEDARAKGNGTCNAIEQIINKNSMNNAEGRIEAINQFSAFGRRHLYKMTKEADEMLRDIIPSQYINRETLKVDWDKVMTEGSIQTNGIYQSRVYVQVMVDLNKILKIIFGSGSDQQDMQYNVFVGNPINPAVTPIGEVRSNKWQLFVMRCEAKSVREMAQNLGLVWGSGADLGIVTA